MDKDPFGYPPTTYLWVIGLAAVASMVRRLNSLGHQSHFSWPRLLIDAVSGGFTGLLTFWLCEWTNTTGPLSAFLIGVSGLMGARAWQGFVEVFRMRLGLPAEPPVGIPEFKEGDFRGANFVEGNLEEGDVK